MRLKCMKIGRAVYYKIPCHLQPAFQCICGYDASIADISNNNRGTGGNDGTGPSPATVISQIEASDYSDKRDYFPRKI